MRARERGRDMDVLITPPHPPGTGGGQRRLRGMKVAGAVGASSGTERKTETVESADDSQAVARDKTNMKKDENMNPRSFIRITMSSSLRRCGVVAALPCTGEVLP